MGWKHLLISAATVVNTTAMADTLDWEFEVLLNDRPIGYHSFTVQEAGDRTVLETEARFDVRILFINAFRYRHSNTETWQNGCLTSIDAVTDRNGETLRVSGAAGSTAFEWTGNDATTAVEGCVRSFAYWNPDVLRSDRLLNSQTGEYEEVSVRFDGPDRVQVGETAWDAHRYRLTTRAGDIVLWYTTDDQRWLALEAPAKGGRVLRYQPRLVPHQVSPVVLSSVREVLPR